MRKDLEELIKLSGKDLEMAKISYANGFYEYACFFSHQCVEKILKAFLLFKKGGYPFIHSITKLINLCAEIDSEFKFLLDINADSLEDYYTGTRYPPMMEVAKEEAKEALEISERVREFVLGKLKFENYKR